MGALSSQWNVITAPGQPCNGAEGGLRGTLPRNLPSGFALNNEVNKQTFVIAVLTCADKMTVNFGVLEFEIDACCLKNFGARN
ncbi:unnamed protein product, partial [Iphiclides podalirius]